MSRMITNHRLWLAVVALLAAVVFLPQRAHAASITFNLCATPGSVTMPDSTVVTIWGYAPGDCTGAPVATLPGPLLTVNQGDVVTVNLYNNLTVGVNTGLLFQGQAIVPDLVGTAPATMKSYIFTADHAGTYLYEAGLIPGTQYQVAMGLYGALIVRPTSAPDVIIPGQAYADPATAYHVEALAVLSEIDPLLNNSATPATFDLRNYKPKYWLINGQAYPNTLNIATAAGNRVLLRYINAGLDLHSMSVLGLNQTVVATDGSLLTHSHSMVAETIAPGQTADTITTVPATAVAGSKFALYDGNLLLHNSSAAGFGGMLTFLEIAPGVPGADIVGPATSAMALTPNPTDGTVNVALSASVSDAATGNANVTAAEYFIDTIGTNGAGTAMAGSFGGPTASVNATLSTALLGTLTSGNHTIYVHGQDSLGNWGATNFVVLNLDKSGPTTSGLTLNPNPSNGTVNVILTGSANDSATGNSNIAAAEYFIGTTGAPGSGTAMTLNTTASPAASLNATIPAATINALAHGNYMLSVRSQDAFGNWGTFATISLKVDKTGPTTSGVTVAPNPNNGTQGSSPTQPAVKVDATFTDVIAVVAAASADSAPESAADSTATDPANNGYDSAAAVHLYLAVVTASPSASADGGVDAAAVVPGTSYVKMGEGFIDTVGAPGTGFPFTPNDGFFDEGAEDGYALIPLTTVILLTNGNHTIAVRAQDGAGNWGATSSTTLLIDKAAPTFTSITLAPPSFIGGSTPTVMLTVNGAGDTGGAGVAGGEYWFGTTDPAPGGGTAFSGLTANIPVSSLAPGTYTVRARIRDAAGNWSTGTNGIRSATLTVATPPFYFSTSGDGTVPGVAASYDDADIYSWNAPGFSRVWDATGSSILGGANVDGLALVDATHFYLSFADNTTVPTLGTVQDEDVVFYNAGVWSVYFDGTVPGRLGGSGNLDIDAFDIVGSTLYFSTVGNTNPPGVGGAADDADVYAWNGTSFSRVFDASTQGVAGGANVDGLSVVDATHLYLSFTGDTTLPGLGTVQDEDVVYRNATVWSLHFDGTGAGLTSGNQDLDAIDIP